MQSRLLRLLLDHSQNHNPAVELLPPSRLTPYPWKLEGKLEARFVHIDSVAIDEEPTTIDQSN